MGCLRIASVLNPVGGAHNDEKASSRSGPFDGLSTLGCHRPVSLEKFPLYHFVSAIIYAQLGMKPEAAEARDRFLQMRPTFFEQWDREVAKRNYGPQDGALLAEGARKAGFPVPEVTAAEVAQKSSFPRP